MAELRYDGSRAMVVFGQAFLWLLAFVVASRLTVPVWLDRFRRVRPTPVAGPVIDFDDDHVPLPTETGTVPVVVPLEFTGPPEQARTQQVPVTQHVGVDVTERPLFGGGDDSKPGSSWVDDMFDDDETEAGSA